MNNKVVQDNNFLENKGNELSINEKRIFYKLVSLIGIQDTGFKTIDLPLREICDEWALEEHNAYGRIVEAVDSLASRNVKETFVNADGKEEHSVITYIEKGNYVKGSGVLSIKLHDSIKPYLVGLTDNFTAFDYSILKNLSSNAMRMYELLKKWEGLKTWTANVGQIRKLFSLENKYRDGSAIEKKIIIPCLAEINEYTDIKVECKSKGRGAEKKFAFFIEKQKGKKANIATQTPKKETNVVNFTQSPAEELFEELWKLYPNKKGKRAVSKKAKEELMQYDKEELIRAVNRYADSVKTTDPKYIKHGSTFFNGAIYDYMDENYDTLPKKFDISRTDSYSEEDTIL